MSLSIKIPLCHQIWIGFKRVMILFYLSLSFQGTLQLRAQTSTWDGGGVGNNWNTATNWVDDVAPVDGDALVFAGTTKLTNTNNIAGLTLNGITFSNNAGAFVIRGNAFTISNNIINNSTNTQTFHQAITLSAPVSLDAADGALVFNGALTNGGNLLTIAGVSNITLAGIVTGSAGIVKNGTGRLILSGANTFVGDITNNAGVIQINNDNRLGNTANDVIFNGGILNVAANITLNSGRQLIGGSDNVILDVSTGNTLTLGTAGQVTNTPRLLIENGNVQINNAGAVTVGTLVQIGDGVGAANSARFSVNAGIGAGNALNYLIESDGRLFQGNNRLVRLLSVAGSGEIELNSPVPQMVEFVGSVSGSNFSGTILGGAHGSPDANSGSRLVRSDTGLQILSGDNTYSSRTYIRGGVLNIRHNNALGQWGTTLVSNDTSIYSTGTLQIEGGLDNVREVFLLGLPATSALGFEGQGAIHNVAGTNRLAGLIVISNHASIQSSAGLLQIAGDVNHIHSNLTFFGNGDIAIVENSVISGAGSIVKTGTGTLTFGGTNANAYTGNTFVSNGVLFLDKPTGTNAISNGRVYVDSGATLRLGASNLIADGVNLTLSGGTFDLNNFNETMGTLDSQGFTVISKILYGTDALTNTLTFANSTNELWSLSAVVHIEQYNRTADFDRLFIGTAAGHITDEQLGKIKFIDPNGLSGMFAAVRGSNGEIVPHTAGDFVWVPDSNGFWETGSNWDAGYAPNSDGASVLLGTNITAPRVISSSSAAGTNILNKLNFEGNQAYTLSNNLTLNFRSSATNDPRIIVRSGSADHQIDANVDVYHTLAPGNRFFVSNNGTGTLTLNGVVSLTNNSMVAGGASRVVFSNTISGTTNATVTVDSSSEVSYRGSNANTYSGQTIVKNGTLTLQKAAAGIDAIAGNLLISNGTVRLEQNEQIRNSSTVDMFSTARLELNGFNETFNTLNIAQSGGIIDFGNSPGGSTITVSNLSFGSNIFHVHNWTGTLGETNNLDRFYVTYDAGVINYQMFFYSDAGTTLVGVGTVYSYSMGAGLYQLVPVPEPGTYALLIVAAICASGFYLRRKFKLSAG